MTLVWMRQSNSGPPSITFMSNYFWVQLNLYLITKILLHDHFTDCSLMLLWDLPAADANFLTDVSSAAQYPSCDNSSIGSVVLRDNRLNTATVAYYSGTTPGSRACFVCDESSGHVLNTTITERVCQNDATWSGSPIICGMLCYMVIYKIVHVYIGEMNI